MSRTLTAGMTGHLATRSHTRCRLALIVLRDGTSIGITDHDKDISFDLIGDGVVTYEAGTGAILSDIVLQVGLDADNCEISGPLKPTGNFTLERIVGGRFNRALVYIAEANWKSLALGSIPLLGGRISEGRVSGGEFTFEVRSDCDLFNQVILRVLTNNCDADYGDARCGATPESVVGTVTAVADALQITVSYPGSYADDYFNAGTVEALTGDLAGTDPVEIQDWSVGGNIVLFIPLVEEPAIGDTFTIKRGCPKSRAACIERNNILNFRGFPDLTGSDQLLRPTIPGQGND